MSRLEQELSKHPVIASVRTMDAVTRAARSPVAAIFILGGSITNLQEMVTRAHDGNKYAFLHIDLAEGLGRDDAAVEWCVRTLGIDGLISTRPALIRRASELGVVTIQRLFLMDSSSFEHGKRLLRATPPEMAEVLPGIAPKAVRQLCQALDKPVIAGGMITERREVLDALAAGAIAVSVSDERLWAI
ncbi:MAG: glycerol-3-phosphate responsive antiterminator [Christensenellales bacterium]|jgi:glycerol uptake operon antiterminator